MPVLNPQHCHIPQVVTYSTVDNFEYQTWKDFSDLRLIDPSRKYPVIEVKYVMIFFGMKSKGIFLRLKETAVYEVFSRQRAFSSWNRDCFPHSWIHYSHVESWWWWWLTKTQRKHPIKVLIFSVLVAQCAQLHRYSRKTSNILQLLMMMVIITIIVMFSLIMMKMAICVSEFDNQQHIHS